MLEFFKKEKVISVLIGTGIMLITLAIIYFYWNDNFDKTQEIDAAKVGQFGDFVGGVVGSIWALAGVILFYLALTEQRKDFETNRAAFTLQADALTQQIEEFRLQRTELENSRKIYEEQSKTQRIQQFESNFYSLLNVYFTIKNNLNSFDTNKDYFATICSKFKDEYQLNCDLSAHHSVMINQYLEMFNENRGNLSHYFKTFYRIIKVIDSNDYFTEKEKVFYAKILRSQLTDFEQLLIFYNSHSPYGFKSQSLILKYNLLKHYPIFNKPEFKFFSQKQKNSELIYFSDWFGNFLRLHTDKAYDIEFDGSPIEERYDRLNCIVGIYYNANNVADIKVFCDKNLSNNNIQLNESEFHEFINCYVNELFIHFSYLNPTKITLSKYKIETDDHNAYCIKIETTEKLNLIKDKY